MQKASNSLSRFVSCFAVGGRTSIYQLKLTLVDKVLARHILHTNNFSVWDIKIFFSVKDIKILLL